MLYYHEIGHENYQFLDRTGAFVPLVDPITSAYRPGARALNYRSELFDQANQENATAERFSRPSRSEHQPAPAPRSRMRERSRCCTRRNARSIVHADTRRTASDRMHACCSHRTGGRPGARRRHGTRARAVVTGRVWPE